MQTPSDRAYWLAWSCVPRVGPIVLKRLYQHFGSLEQAWSALPLELAQVEGIGNQTLEAIDRHRTRCNPQTLLVEHQAKNPNFWTPADDPYPRLLREIPSFPPLLYFQGRVNPLENLGQVPCVAIVGTRQPSDYGRRWTRRLTQALVQRGITIVSGLAEGIDTEAHRACLDAGGRTIAIMGTGVDRVYPRHNETLYQQILAQGVVMSEYPQGTPPDRMHFPQRNRIIAGLCRAILIMEAGQKSGALITAYQANDFNRDVYILPGSLDNPQSRGCLELLSRGAQVILGEAELLELLGELPHLDPPQNTPLESPPHPPQILPTPPTPAPPIDLDPQLAQVLACFEKDSLAFDTLVTASQLPAPTLSASLLQLELLGLITQLPGLRYQRIAP